MKFIVISLLSVSLLFASTYEGTTEDLGIEIEARSTISSELLDNPDGTQYCATPEALDPATLADPNDPSSAFEYFSPIERIISLRDEGPLTRPEYDWNNDILVYPGRVGSGQDFDVDEDTGDIYAIFDTDHATGDSLVSYRSQDGGVTWSFFGVATNGDNAISNPKIRVVKDGAGTAWVVMMGIWQETGDDNLWTRRFTADGGSATFEQAAADVEFADMDGGIGSGAYAYITYVPAGAEDVFATRNSLNGAGWVNNTSLFVTAGVTPYPAIAVGAGGTVAVAFIDNRLTTDPQVRIKRSTSYAASWLGSAQVSNNAADNLLNPDIAFSHGSTQIGWITVTYDFTATDENFGYYHSDDSGASWTYGTIFAGGGTDENLGNIRARKDTGDLTVAFNSDPGDDVYFTWASAASPTSFTTPVAINDFAATGYWTPTAGWAGSSSAVLYTTYSNNYSLFFDWWGNTAIEGESAVSITSAAQITSSPNPFTDMATISFSVTGVDPVSISVYNIAGRLVKTIVSNESFTNGDHSVQWSGIDNAGERVTPGVYFCRLNTGDSILTDRMVMIL